jgi:hypothetical protein
MKRDGMKRGDQTRKKENKKIKTCSSSFFNFFLLFDPLFLKKSDPPSSLSGEG